MELSELAAQYLEEALLLEHRIEQLEFQVKSEKQLEARRKLRKRIYMLCNMVNDCRATAFYLEHYYDKPKEAVYVVKPKHERTKQKYSRHGYGAPAPAATMGGEKTDKKRVSGMGAMFLRKNPAKGYRGKP